MPIQNTIKISRSGLNLFLQCPRCFWLDLRHKIKRPPSFPYTLASAVDYLVKQEFDKYRVKGELPPIFIGEKLSAKLFQGSQLSAWRDNKRGIQYFDEDLNAMLYGAVDDVLEFSDGSLAVIDYKSTGSREIRIYDDYQRQMDIYTFLLSKNGYQTQSNAYFVYYLVQKDGGGFKNALPFKEELRAITVNPDWVASSFEQAVNVARQDSPPLIPPAGGHCDHCHYVEMASQHKIAEDINI